MSITRARCFSSSRLASSPQPISSFSIVIRFLASGESFGSASIMPCGPSLPEMCTFILQPSWNDLPKPIHLAMSAWYSNSSMLLFLMSSVTLLNTQNCPGWKLTFTSSLLAISPTGEKMFSQCLCISGCCHHLIQFASV